ncbi:MAG: threonine ammonia-lyase [Acidobacteria bacterium]|nr:MAG: threonine ammonia-lyase [Acidobacteriota bacterium]
MTGDRSVRNDRDPSESSPTLTDFFLAHRAISDFLRPTAHTRSQELESQVGGPVYLKHENLNETRSFKIRGALNSLLRLSADQRGRGIVTASTGNHGLAVTYASQLLGIHATIIVPATASPTKVQRMRGMNADLRCHGHTLGTALAFARELADAEKLVFIEDGDNADLMIGAGTIAIELLQDIPNIEVLLVPVGGGNLIAGIACCAKQINHRLRVVGVQSEEASAVYRSWVARSVVRHHPRTFASGLSADYPGALALRQMLRYVDDFVMVSEQALYTAMGLLLAETGQLVEGAGAAATAALVSHTERWRGHTVALLISGGNADLEEVTRAIELYGGEAQRPIAMPTPAHER